MPILTAGLQREIVDLVLPTRCAACHDRGAAVCRGCAALVRADCFVGGARRVKPSPVPAGMPETWATAPLDGVLRRLLTSHKDDGRRDLAPVLGRLLAEAIRAAGANAGPALVLVPVPSSRRSRRTRGDRPLEGMALAAAAHLPGEVRVVRLLRSVRRVHDQSGLDHRQRRVNVEHSMMATDLDRVGGLRGSRVVLVDDIVTTGATLVEAARALQAVGLEARAAVVAATQRSPVVAQRFPD